MKTHIKALGAGIFAAFMVLLGGVATAAAPSACTMPQLNGGTGTDAVAAIDRDRQALLRYEACLEEEELYQSLSAGSTETTARQRQAAANLRRTLEAWQQTRRAAEEARLQRKGS
ncbi:hypothetical protein [Niveispirillum sp. BGYR6]|uniref:hypothetical protein n=1 Tax=Niveispirillum sp. BGYR6 TaxID=2971249 RepID=UPI0022B9C4B7|nr:hypothetical protein [Niveispirillum sp. BGYR6]MDG5495435.1 hypothetical protein [Niveispirillum sp. BGYR6]